MESSKRSPVVPAVCVNPNCRADTNLNIIAPSFVKAYYGLAIEEQIVRKVCQACYESAESHQNHLFHLLLSNQNLASGPKKSNNNQVEVLSIDDDEDTEIVEEHHVEPPEEELEVEENLELFINSIMEKYNFNDQMEASIKKLESNLADNDVKQAEIDELTANLEKDIDQFRNSLYSGYEPQIQHLDAIDITDVQESNDSSSVPAATSPQVNPRQVVNLPPSGVLHFPKVKKNRSVYAMKDSLLAPWKKGIVMKTEEGPETLCTVLFDIGTNGVKRKFPLKYLAYAEPSSKLLTVGSRVIAQCFEDKDGKTPSAYYAGVIAEAPNYVNQNRYLLFFDDGYAQYCNHEQILLVCHRAEHVWHDVHTDSRPFVSNYLKQFPERAMVKLQSGQTVKAELNGRWFMAVVQTVDASLARILFTSAKISQWIYRGSTRFHPLFEMLAIAEARKNQRATRPTHNLALANRKNNAPYIEFTLRDVDSPSPPWAAESSDNSDETGAKAVARKSSGKKSLPNSSRFGLSQSAVHGKKEDQGKIITHHNELHQDIAFEPHQCGCACVSDFPYTEANFKNVNPLTIPMKCGWSREVTKRTPNSQRNVVYRGPCGRRMRNMEELHRYLRFTRCELSVDLFCYDHFVHCFSEFQPDDVQSRQEDISNGQEERVLISCVNSIDTSLPEYVEYTTQRIPREGVDLNLDPSFLVCCDCTNDCQDKEKCACWQLTLQSGCPSGTASQHTGYHFRRLDKRVQTGVYECNPRCACRKTCLNRVAQRPLQLRLQLFRTEKRGWGIRCLDDIPKGEFICVYSGHVLTEQEANKDGTKYGDEYLFDLDLIETSENTKEGYESDVESISSHCSDDDLDSCGSTVSSLPSLDHSEVQSNRALIAKQNSTSEASMKLATEEIIVSDEMEDSANKTRKLYGANEHCYVMDAKTIGNIGRYLNHCCSPNVFSQNVFVDSHDLRFHWVGFFTYDFVRAGTELTWDYNYTVNSVPGKKIECHCGAKKCRGRLL